MSVLVNFVVMLLAMNIVIEFVSANDAITLLSENKSGKFVLNQEALTMLKQFSGPVRVIAAIGDARVGKSTALNYLRHSFKRDFHQSKMEKVFETGSTMTAVTRGVWLSFVPDGPDEGLLLLDVEGTDLGNDEHTTKLSIFTALLSSSLMVFMKESPSNHIFEFLYKICRVSENLLDPDYVKNFPRLIPVMRGALETPKEYSTTTDYIKDAFTKPNPEEKANLQATIGKFFPKETIEVFELPYIKNFDNESNDYLDQILIITRHLRGKVPQKKTLSGGQMNGKVLATLAEKLVNDMNTNKQWKSQLTNLMVLFEKNNCLNGFDDHIEPLLSDRLTAEVIEQKKDRHMDRFEKICPLEDERGVARDRLKSALKAARKRDSDRFYEKLKYAVLTAGAVGGMFLTYAHWGVVFSDVRLKQDIVPVSGSAYSLIGLQEVKWTWNEEAKRLGLNGVGEGVVAQEVEKLFPWAVTEGYDGYKRVNYLVLKVMIKWKSLWK